MRKGRFVRISVTIAVAVMISSGPVLAGEKVEDPSQKMVCKTERFVGSNISTRICKTRAEWDLAKKQAQELLDLKRGLRVDKPKPGGG